MRCAICRTGADAADSFTTNLDRLRVSWLRFGRDFFCWSTDSAIDWHTLGASLGNIKLHALPTNEHLFYLVTQKGGSFQRAYPDVPVVFDRGRHLVVSLDPQAKHIVSHAARYSIRPLIGSETIVETLERPEKLPHADRGITSAVAQLNQESFADTLKQLVSFPTRHSLTAHYLTAAEHLSKRLREMGYQVTHQNVAIPGGETKNIIAAKKGVGTAEHSLTLVTAHLDSINHPVGSHQSEHPDAPAPGADDNASGCAGLMEIARIFASKSTAHDLKLVLFGGEEQGLLGSQHFVDNMTQNDRVRLKSVVNMDMIAVVNGTQGLTVLLEGGDPVSRAMMTGLANAAYMHTNLTVTTSFTPYNSDHVSFIKSQLPAVLTIEGDDSANKNVHSANDTLDHINYDLALEILRMNMAFVATEIESE